MLPKEYKIWDSTRQEYVYIKEEKEPIINGSLTAKRNIPLKERMKRRRKFLNGRLADQVWDVFS